jgi:hypothetical protein
VPRIAVEPSWRLKHIDVMAMSVLERTRVI